MFQYWIIDVFPIPKILFLPELRDDVFVRLENGKNRPLPFESRVSMALTLRLLQHFPIWESSDPIKESKTYQRIVVPVSKYFSFYFFMLY